MSINGGSPHFQVSAFQSGSSGPPARAQLLVSYKNSISCVLVNLPTVARQEKCSRGRRSSRLTQEAECGQPEQQPHVCRPLIRLSLLTKGGSNSRQSSSRCQMEEVGSSYKSHLSKQGQRFVFYEQAKCSGAHPSTCQRLHATSIALTLTPAQAHTQDCLISASPAH